MGFGSWVADTFAKSSTDIITSLADTADRFIVSGEDKQKFKMELLESEMKMKRLTMETENMYNKDRQNAREMYMKDSSLQKVFALVFLGGYLVLSIAMVAIVFGAFGFGPGIELEAFQASIISMVFTAMSTKVNTITDFLFGGSKNKDDSEKRLAETFTNQNK